MTDELKKVINNANTEKEEIAVAEKFKLTIRELSDDELNNIAGGYTSTCAPDCYKKNNKCWCPK